MFLLRLNIPHLIKYVNSWSTILVLIEPATFICKYLNISITMVLEVKYNCILIPGSLADTGNVFFPITINVKVWPDWHELHTYCKFHFSNLESAHHIEAKFIYLFLALFYENRLVLLLQFKKHPHWAYIYTNLNLHITTIFSPKDHIILLVVVEKKSFKDLPVLDFSLSD